MLVVINYTNINNGHLQKALTDLSAEYIYSDNEFDICRADKLILPGHGEASAGVKKIHLLNLFTILRVIKTPVLGIGLGMEIMSDRSTEENVSCLGIFDENLEMFDRDISEIPFRGFHKIKLLRETNILNGIIDNESFYFDSSFYLPQNEFSTAVSENGGTVLTASIEKGNFYGVQFHPEESGDAGLLVLKNFLNL